MSTWRSAIVAAIGWAVLLAAPAGAAEKKFVRESYGQQIPQVEQAIKAETRLGTQRNVERLIEEEGKQFDAGEYRKSLEIAQQLIVLAPNDWRGWKAYAEAAQNVEPKDYSEKWKLEERALIAAYAAYHKAASNDDEATTLAVLADTLGWRGIWRPALEAYKLSLAQKEDADVRSTYEEARKEHGFRITDYKVENDAAAPRVCFEFSEELARGKVDFAPFVSVTGADRPAITPEGAKLCVEGLKHGSRYQFVVRKGLPSAVDEALLQNYDYDVYVRDRAPQVAFGQRGYVLPKSGQQGVPVTTVNTDKVSIEVFRVSDRNLTTVIKSDEFLKAINGYAAKELLRTRARSVWSGTMATAVERNVDVVTAFPVTEAVGKLAPGVYVMTARPGDALVKETPPPSAAPSSDEDDGSDYDETDYEDRATQWFVVSDVGLTALSGIDGVTVVARSLSDASPVAGAKVTLIARNNEVLGETTTDAAGLARFDPGLSRGLGGLAPGLVLVSRGDDDHGFLTLSTPAFDLTDRGVDGRAAPGALDAMVVPERGVYRSGETVHVTTILRDAAGGAVADVPLTLIVTRPDGVEYRRTVVADQGGGGRALSVPLLSGVSTGTWRVAAFADLKRPAVGEATFMVEDYVPERLDVTLKPKAERLPAGAPAEIDVTANFLFGAPGSGLEVEASVTVDKAKEITIPGLAGYRAGLADESFEASRTEGESVGTTDDKGRASISVSLPEVESSQPLTATISVSVAEEGGRAVERTLELPILPKEPVIALKPLFDPDGLTEGSRAEFDVVAANPDGRRLALKAARYDLFELTTRWVWFNKDGVWDYERVVTAKKIGDGNLDLTPDKPARVSVPVGWGEYRLEISSPTGEAAKVSFLYGAGWSGRPAASRETPDTLDVKLDKTAFQPGEDLKLRVTSRFAGKATVAILSEKLLHSEVIDVPAGGTTVSVPVKAEWGAGAYATVFAHRPLDVAAHRMPGRAIGLRWFEIAPESRRLAVDLGAPQVIRPRGTLALPVKVTGMTPGETAYVTVAAVDAGILNLTGYKPPNASQHFFGQRRMGVEIRDLYALLIDGMQGARGQIRSGGDGSMAELSGSPPREAPLARYSGVVTVGADGAANISFDIPAFNGTVRVMALAWSKSKVGQANADVFVRDAVVMTPTLPRFLALGDVSRLHVQLDNVEGAAGDYTIDVDARGPVTLPADATRASVRLADKGRASVTIPVTGAGLGTASIAVRVTGPGNVDVTKDLVLGVQPATPAVDRRLVRPLAPGASVTLSDDVFADFVPGTGRMSLSVAPIAALDVPSLLSSLDRYPYGCTEQTVSRAMPLLYLNQLAKAESLALDAGVDGRIREAITRVLTRQGSNGSFGLWSVGGEDVWLDAFVADFLTRARERGFEVPKAGFDLALDRLRNHVANAQEVTGTGADLAYALYVLARNGRPVMGDLRYLADVKLAEFKTPLAKAQLGASLALLGDRGRAQPAFASAADDLAAAVRDKIAREDFGSVLRDGAGIVTLIAETGVGRDALRRTADRLDRARAETTHLSTQEMTWLVLAANAMGKDIEKLTLTVDGQPHTGAFYRTWRGFALDGAPVTVTNTSQIPAQLVVSTAGHPTTLSPAVAQGFKIERAYYKLDGTKVDPAKTAQNERLVAVLTITDDAPVYTEMLVVDHLPAGFEIDNPNLVNSGNVSALSFLPNDVVPENAEYRDDRFVAAFTRSKDSKKSFQVAYMVRAVAPGRYVHPPAVVEDMYRPERFGRTGFGLVEVTAKR